MVDIKTNKRLQQVTVILLPFIMAVLTSLLLPHIALADGVVTNCANDTQLRNLINTANPGIITFNCGGPATIPVNSQILINTINPGNSMVISGSGVITLAAQGAHRLFRSTTGNINVTLQGLSLINGNPSGTGGAIDWRGANSSLTVIDSVFQNNRGSYGGAIYGNANGINLTIRNSSFIGNRTTNGSGNGGAIRTNTDNMRVNIVNSTFYDNSARSQGGALALRAIARITNTTFYSNTDNDGDAIERQGGSITLYNSIVTNSCNGASNTIINGGHNYGLTSSLCSLSPAITLTVNNLAALNLAPLDYYGGSTPVLPPNVGSPVIDAGNNATCASNDQHGTSRPFNTTCDVGAIEFVPPNSEIQLVSKTASSASLFAGQPITYVISFRNNGPGIASGIRITDTVPAALTGVTANSDLALTEISPAPNYVWTVPDMNPSQTGVITVVGTVPNTISTVTSLNNQVIISSTTSTDTNPNNNSASVTASATPRYVSLTAVDANRKEGDTGTTPFTFSVKLNVADSAGPITVQYQTVDGTGANPAVGGSDFISTTSTVVIPAGETEATFIISVNGDVEPEFDETFHVRLLGVTAGNANLSPSAADRIANGTIISDDPFPPTFVATDVAVVEGDTGSKVALMEYKLINELNVQGVKIDYQTISNTATAGSDYTAVSKTLVIPPGVTSGFIVFEVLGDTLDELDEAFTVNFTNTVNVKIPTNPYTATVVITDDDQAVLSVNDVVHVEGTGANTVLSFEVSLSNPSDREIVVAYETANGSLNPALAGSDYIARSGTLTFSVDANTGQTLNQKQTITVAVIADSDPELNETFVMRLTSASNATIADNEGVATILDDDQFALVSIGDANVVEGTDNQATLNLTLSPPRTFPVVVTYTTADGTATAGQDYTAVTSQTVTFAPGQTSQAIVIPIIDDLLNEVDEIFFVNLVGVSGANINDGQGVVKIFDNDAAVPPPNVSISSGRFVEGTGGTSLAVFTLTLSTAAGKPSTVRYITIDGTAKSNVDFIPAKGEVTFPAGTTVQTVTVSIVPDQLDELDETFSLEIGDAKNATITVSRATATIVDDDTARLKLNDTTVVEGDSGLTDASLTLSIFPPADRVITVAFATMPLTAKAGVDYVSRTGLLTINPFVTTKIVTVAVKGDTLAEGNETFKVKLTNPQNATLLDGEAIVTIVDDDLTTLSINDISLPEGDSGLTEAIFEVVLSRPASNLITVTYSTANGSATASIEGQAVLNPDYMAARGTLTFTPGITRQTLTIYILGDTFFEQDETFFVNLTAATVPFADAQGQGVIKNDDEQQSTLPTIFIADASLTEGDVGLTSMSFAVTVSPPAPYDVNMPYLITDVTTTMGQDYLGSATTQTVFIPANTTNAVITVPVVGDLVSEADETFTISFIPNGQLQIGKGAARGTILNDDEVLISINDLVVREGDAAHPNAVFTITLSRPSDGLVSVEYATQEPSPSQIVLARATANVDYTSRNQFLVFQPGETEQIITIPILDDTQIEQPESFVVNLSNPVRAKLVNSRAMVTILDDDGGSAIQTASRTEVMEGDSATRVVSVAVSLWLSSNLTVTVDYQTADGTASAGQDYQPISGSLTFPPGVTEQFIAITINGDTVSEADETILIQFSNPVNAILKSSQVELVIIDSDPVELTVDDVRVFKGQPTGSSTPSGSAYRAEFKVRLSVPSQQQVTVNYATENGSAQAGVDYISTNGTLTFKPGEQEQTVSVSLINDQTVEPELTFFLNLQTATQATIRDGRGQATIVDDDGQPKLYLDDVRLLEGNAGLSAAVVTVHLWPMSNNPVSVNYATTDGTATIADNDYQTQNGLLRFAVGETRKAITISVVGDPTYENDETFFLNLTNPTGNALIRDGQATLTILNDDALPRLSIADAVPVVEGNLGTTTQAVFRISLSKQSAQAVQFDYTTLDGTATAADGDYLPISGSLQIPAGQQAISLSVTITGDNVAEADEYFQLRLSRVQNATLGQAVAQAVITNDDVRILAVYLPVLLKQPAPQITVTPTPASTASPQPKGPPDLIVERIVAADNSVELVIKNLGGSVSVEEAFWVEFYLNPSPPPTGVNQSWQGRSTQGVAWRVTAPALPLGAGQSLPLRYSLEAGAANRYAMPEFTDFVGNVPAGITVYAQVDSNNASTTFGNVLESHEKDGGAYNNIKSSVSLGVVTPTPSPTPKLPDLVVRSVSISNKAAEIIIENQGAGAVSAENGFWVDLYVDPNPAPTGVNQTWVDVAKQGLVWGVTGVSMEPGETLTLRYSASASTPFYNAVKSRFSGDLQPGTPIYVQVDSLNPQTTHGAVLETHEANGGAYNNILGPISSVTNEAISPSDVQEMVPLIDVARLPSRK